MHAGVLTSGTYARLNLTDAPFYMGGGREEGPNPPGGKITKIRGPENSLIGSKLLVSGGGVGYRLNNRILLNPSLETVNFVARFVCLFGRFLLVFLFMEVAQSLINSKQFELIKLEIL